MNQQIQARETGAETPICPHCESPIQEVGVRKVQSALGVRYLYFCRNCKKALGVSHRKGFWMG